MNVLSIEILNPSVQMLLMDLVDLQFIRLKDSPPVIAASKQITQLKSRYADRMQTHFASEMVLAKDWDNAIENEVWKNL